MGHPDDDPLAYKDAVFLSPHKFIGGPGTPGVLAVRRELLRNRVPTVPGGGTVAYVNPSEHRYLDDPVEREEGGTPAIVESIRAGLVFQLKQAVGAGTIQELERSFIRRAVASWGDAEPASLTTSEYWFEYVSDLDVSWQPIRGAPLDQVVLPTD